VPTLAASLWQTPPAYAASRGLDVHQVLGWIKTGQLQAVNFSDGAQRPRYRISPEAIAAFEAARSARPEPKITRIRRRKDPNITEYF
jgi:hypothetical protein